jgi:glycosyltransferase involved in cell wall biosynthesis
MTLQQSWGKGGIPVEDRLRICFVSFMFAPVVGGAEARTEKQARQLRAFGHEVTIVTLRYNRQWKRKENLSGLPVIRIGGLFKRNGQLRVGRLGHIPLDMNLFFQLWRMRHAYDILHVFQITPLAFVAALIGKLTHTPVVISSQCAPTDKKQGKYTQQHTTLMNDTLPMADYLQIDGRRVITDDISVLPRLALGGQTMLNFLRTSDSYFQALSTRSKTHLIEQGFRADHIVHIPGSVHTEKFQPSIEQRPNPTLQERSIICIARLEYSKGIDVLLHAWARLMHAPSAWRTDLKPRLRIVGDGELRPQLERIATELNILDSVEFLGTRTDILPLLQQSWGFILPSRWEGMPNALLEAMSCGLPCIATRVSGSEDLISNSQNGILVEPEQPAAMTLALRQIIADADFAQQLGKAARTTIVRDYQLSNIVNQCLTLYRQLIAPTADKSARVSNADTSNITPMADKSAVGAINRPLQSTDNNYDERHHG